VYTFLLSTAMRRVIWVLVLDFGQPLCVSKWLLLLQLVLPYCIYGCWNTCLRQCICNAYSWHHCMSECINTMIYILEKWSMVVFCIPIYSSICFCHCAFSPVYFKASNSVWGKYKPVGFGGHKCDLVFDRFFVSNEMSE
jgi:hypothetical protein